MFKELSDLRHIRNFNRVILPVSLVFFIYTFGWGITSPVFSIYVNKVTGSPFLAGLILSITTMAGIFLNIPFGIIENRMNLKRVLQVVLLFYSGLALFYPKATAFLPLLALSIGRGEHLPSSGLHHGRTFSLTPTKRLGERKPAFSQT